MTTDRQRALMWSALPGTLPAESAVRIALVCKESPAAQTQGLRDQSKNTES